MSKNPDQFQVPPPYSQAGSVQNTGYPPQQHGQYPPQQHGQYPPTMTYPPQQQGQTVVINRTGNCPNCHVGYMVENFSLCGILWLILCFPLGLICFLTMKDRKCGQCGYEVSTS